MKDRRTALRRLRHPEPFATPRAIGSKHEFISLARAPHCGFKTNEEYDMKTTQHDKSAAGARSILTRRLQQPADEPASGIAVVELGAEELDRVSGGMASTRLARAGTTCSPCADDCGQ